MEGYVAQPAWTCPVSEEELTVFAQEQGGSVVLKPTNGQASAGVLRCDDLADMLQHRAAFQDFSDDPLRSASIERPRLLAEQRLHGPEYSVECLVRNGNPIFTNITAKSVAPGMHPVELGHVAPAPISRDLEERLHTSMARLIRLTRVHTAVLHAEWIVQEDVPHLIECAGRLPGDNITTLVADAWGFDFVRAWVTLLCGEVSHLPAAPRAAAAIWFLSADEGTVASVNGIEDATSLPGIRETVVDVKPGDRTDGLRSSWARVGHIMATGPTARTATAAAQHAATLVTVAVE